MYAKTKHGNGASVAVVCWIYDELIVKRDLPGKHRKAIICLHDLFAARIWQHAVADEDAQATGIEKRLVHAGNAVYDTGDAERVVNGISGVHQAFLNAGGL